MHSRKRDKNLNKMPQSIYRYLEFNEERLNNILVSNELFFYSPTELNDPFDSKIQFNYRDCDEPCFRKFVKEFLQKSEKVLSEDELAAKVDEIMLSRMYLSPEWQEHFLEHAKATLQPTLDEMGLLCLSSKNDDILMWSHYSEGHSGLCLEFDKKLLENTFPLFRINYSNKYPSFKDFHDAMIKDNTKRLYEMNFLTKSKHWEYEKEWRIIMHWQNIKENGGVRSFQYPSNMLTGIIFGCRLSELNRKRILEMIKQRPNKPKIYQAKRSEQGFAVAISEM